MASGTVEWWKEVPCHFTWNLAETNVDHKSLKTNLESKKLDWSDEYSSPPCQPLLFLGFLNVSKFKGSPEQSPNEAIKLFKNVEEKAEAMEAEEEKDAFRTVALANQIWSKEIINQSQDVKEDDDARPAETGTENYDEDVERLKQLWDRKTKRVEAYIEGIAVFALARLGPKKYKEGEERCRRALRIVPDNPVWHYNLGCLIGRQIRCNLVMSSRGGYKHITDEIKCYEEAVELNPEFDLARCELAQALVKVPNRKPEAFEHIARVQGKSCSTVIKKGRFYRFQKDYDKALEILQKGESEFNRPRGELFFQISLIYSTLAYKAGFDKKWAEKKDNLEMQIKYTDKCLSIEPRHHVAMIRKAEALGSMRKCDEAKAMFEEAMKEMKDMPGNLIEVQYAFAEFLTAMNRKRVTSNAAELYQAVISTAISIVHHADDYADGDVDKAMKKFVTNSKRKLDEFYKGDETKLSEIESMIGNFNIIGLVRLMRNVFPSGSFEYVLTQGAGRLSSSSLLPD